MRSFPANGGIVSEGVNVSRHLVLALATVLLVGGCVFYTQEAERPVTLGWPAAGIDTLEISTPNGAITVTAVADTAVSAVVTLKCKGRDDADAEAHLDDIVLADTIAGRALRLRASMPNSSNRQYQAGFVVRVPAGVVLRLLADNGAVSVTGMAAHAGVDADNGAVTVVGHGGPARVEADNGAIDCDCSAVPAGAELDLHSSNGRVTLHLPSDVSLAFDAWTSNGVVRLEGLTASYTRNEDRHKTGSIGTGAASATVSSSNGSITLRAR
jgi:hypothetical protein